MYSHPKITNILITGTLIHDKCECMYICIYYFITKFCTFPKRTLYERKYPHGHHKQGRHNLNNFSV